MNRPTISPEEFIDNEVLLSKVIQLLKNQYRLVASTHDVKLSTSLLDKSVFPEVFKQIQPITDRETEIIEGFFDTFCGSITMNGEEETFWWLERLIKKDLFKG